MNKEVSEVLTDYEPNELIGIGAFSRVFTVRRKSTNETFVWKEFSYGTMSYDQKQMICDEVNILRNLNHQNIVRFYDNIIDHSEECLYLIQEYCDGGDLASFIRLKRNRNERIPETFIWAVLSQISSALLHCHGKQCASGKKILHRDLKPSNIFLCKRENSYCVKLGDFGFAKILDQSIFAKTFSGTPYYMSPEQISQQKYKTTS